MVAHYNENDGNCALVFQGQTYPFREEYANSKFVRRNLPWFQRFTRIRLKEVCEGAQKYNPLLKTMYEQPAILAVMLLKAREEESHKHKALMGHSFGELIALRTAGVVKSDEDAMFLAQSRGMCMAQANLKNPGSMAALVGNISMPFVDYLCEKNETYMANVNVPGEQVVISGKTKRVKAVCEVLSSQGVHIFPIDIGGAFHSPEMEEAKNQWQDSVEQIEFNPPRGTNVIMMSTGRVENDPDVIRECLLRQLTGSVYFQRAVDTLVSELKIEEIHEVGSKKTLTGFIKKITRRLSRNK